MSTKEIILNTAKQLISEVGFHRTTTALLAKRANISEGTIYRHFESKDDILVHILKELDSKYNELMLSLRGRTEDDDICSIEAVLQKHFKFVEENEPAIKIVLNSYSVLPASKEVMESIVDRLKGFFDDCLAFSKERGIVMPDIPVKETAWMLIIFMFGITRAKLYWPEMGDLSPHAVDFCRRSILGGVMVPSASD